MSNAFLKTLLGLSLGLVLIGGLGYLQLAFEKADARTAVRLVEEASVDGKPLVWKIDRVIPPEFRRCKASVKKRFFGHMEVLCHHTQKSHQVLAWLVNVSDGMVKPSNEASVRLGQGQAPW